MILTENELFAQFVLLSGSKIYFFWQKYTSQTKCFFGSLSNWSLWVKDDVTLLGGTSVYLGAEFRSVLSGVVNISARGRIGSQELEFARKMGIKVVDVSPADQARLQH